LQPFGLFSLLQTLAGGVSSAKTEPADSVQTPPTPPPARETDDTHGEVNESNRQAILQFLQAHDQRAKKTKK
jgi:hypothetical protein